MGVGRGLAGTHEGEAGSWGESGSVAEAEEVEGVEGLLVEGAEVGPPTGRAVGVEAVSVSDAMGEGWAMGR
ncbi:hypothetical protein BSZ07_36110 [Streptomyces sp. M1013]|nr:hypothetical protein BSZ07_36110 [Streptomyces sp. M1013]